MYKIFIAICLINIATVLSVQAQELQCGNSVLFNNNIQIQSFLQSDSIFNTYIQRYKAEGKDRSEEVLTIPVVVHIVVKDSIQDNISLERVRSQIEATNKDLRRQNKDAEQTRPQFQEVATDCQIELCLATKLPDGTAFQGVLWHSYPDFDDPTQINTIAPATMIAPERYLNVWVVPVYWGLGWGQLPWDTSTPIQGIVMLQSVFGTIGENLDTNFTEGGVFTHEVGHYLGLYHIFHQGFQFLGRCDLLNDGSISDYCNDTPLEWNEPITMEQCDIGERSCFDDNTTYISQTENFMFYNTDKCINMFTKEQRIRMRAVLDSMRAGLVSAENLEITGACKVVSVPTDSIMPSLKIWPQPAKNIINIQFTALTAGEHIVQLYSLLGSLVWEKNIWCSTEPFTYSLPLETFPTGRYILRIQHPEYQLSKQVDIVR